MLKDVDVDFDAVVVGSGFGGSVTAYRLREAGQKVCLLERGRAFKPGEFPRSPRKFAKNFWDPSRELYGMFDIWTFDHIEAVVSSCLGGGSIIYANVLMRKPSNSFSKTDGEYWPLDLADLEPHYCNVEKMIAPQTYPFDVAPYSETLKTQAFETVAEELPTGKPQPERVLPNLAVTFANPGQAPVPGVPIEAGGNYHNCRRYTCRLCGECNIGCNFGSKNTLDFNYLSRFSEKGGEIRTLADVKTIRPRREGGFEIGYDRHDPVSGTRVRTLVTAERLVLAAGSLGTTYLLLSNAHNFPDLNTEPLGSHWCGNGDLLGFLKKADRDLDPEFGPVITSALCYEHDRYYIEDGGNPAFLEWLTEATKAFGFVRRICRFAWNRLENKLLDRPISNISGELSALLGDGASSARGLPLLGMGRDVPDGRLSLKGQWLENDWKIDSSRDFYDSLEGSMKDLAGVLGGDFSAEPLWYFKRLITAHPVGGCPMGRSPDEGVVDQYGQVFGVPGLAIADGSVMPGPVGPNPSLTIAAIADRSADWMIDNWST